MLENAATRAVSHADPSKSQLQRADLWRYLLWIAVAETALENRQYYRMTTTWLPHLATNTLSLLLPNLFRLLSPPVNTFKPHISDQSDLMAIEQTVVGMVRDNPNWVGYVTPLALGYILSHPRFNIYKGRMADLRFAGLGLDAIPHSATAFGLTALAADTAEYAAQTIPRRNIFYPLIEWAARHPGLFTGLVLGAATLFWESGEYRIYRHELKLRGEMSKINMQWSLEDTIRDVIANALGWLAANVLRARR